MTCLREHHIIDLICFTNAFIDMNSLSRAHYSEFAAKKATVSVTQQATSLSVQLQWYSKLGRAKDEGHC